LSQFFNHENFKKKLCTNIKKQLKLSNKCHEHVLVFACTVIRATILGTLCSKRSDTLSISSSFFARIFRANFLCQKLKNWLLGLKFWRQKFRTKNAHEKRWWNRHTVVCEMSSIVRRAEKFKPDTESLNHVKFVQIDETICVFPYVRDIKVRTVCCWVMMKKCVSIAGNTESD